MTIHEAEQIVVLEATETFSRDRMVIESIIVRGTGGGTYVINLGNVTLSLTTTNEALTKQFILNRSANSINLASGPADAVLYVLLESR